MPLLLLFIVATLATSGFLMKDSLAKGGRAAIDQFKCFSGNEALCNPGQTAISAPAQFLSPSVPGPEPVPPREASLVQFARANPGEPARVPRGKPSKIRSELATQGWQPELIVSVADEHLEPMKKVTEAYQAYAERNKLPYEKFRSNFYDLLQVAHDPRAEKLMHMLKAGDLDGFHAGTGDLFRALAIFDDKVRAKSDKALGKVFTRAKELHQSGYARSALDLQFLKALSDEDYSKVRDLLKTLNEGGGIEFKRWILPVSTEVRSICSVPIEGPTTELMALAAIACADPKFVNRFKVAAHNFRRSYRERGALSALDVPAITLLASAKREDVWHKTVLESLLQSATSKGAKLGHPLDATKLVWLAQRSEGHASPGEGQRMPQWVGDISTAGERLGRPLTRPEMEQLMIALDSGGELNNLIPANVPKGSRLGDIPLWSALTEEERVEPREALEVRFLNELPPGTRKTDEFGNYSKDPKEHYRAMTDGQLWKVLLLKEKLQTPEFRKSAALALEYRAEGCIRLEKNHRLVVDYSKWENPLFECIAWFGKPNPTNQGGPSLFPNQPRGDLYDAWNKGMDGVNWSFVPDPDAPRKKKLNVVFFAGNGPDTIVVDVGSYPLD